MIWKFSLYGFLKNLKFFDPFIILFFLEIGLSFFEIGLLISFRSICINIVEVPSGVCADLYGRKNAMIISIIAYIISFIIFTFSNSMFLLFPAMLFFSIGEAYRTGTHKAMIFDWLKTEGRLKDKIKVYGYTRSWSQIGSAIAVIIGALIVIYYNGYRWVFLFSIIPYLFCVWNLATYPSYLNERMSDKINFKEIVYHLFNVLKSSFKKYDLRKLIIQNTVYDGVFEVSKTYLQPLLKSQAIAFTLIAVFATVEANTAIMVAIVYFILHIISAFGARNAHHFLKIAGNEQKASGYISFIASALLMIVCFGVFIQQYVISIIAFVFYYVLQNLWTPIIVSRYDDLSGKHDQATILSIESQTQAVGVMILAPIAGFIADKLGLEYMFAVLAVIMVVVSFYILRNKTKN